MGLAQDVSHMTARISLCLLKQMSPDARADLQSRIQSGRSHSQALGRKKSAR